MHTACPGWFRCAHPAFVPTMYWVAVRFRKSSDTSTRTVSPSMTGQTRGCLLAPHEGRHSSRLTKGGIQAEESISVRGSLVLLHLEKVSRGLLASQPEALQNNLLSARKQGWLNLNFVPFTRVAERKMERPHLTNILQSMPAATYLRRAHHSVGVCVENPVDVGEPPRRRSPR